MKRKISTSILIAALITVLLVSTALAVVSLLRSAESGVIQQGREAVLETYRLTPSTLGLFLAETSREGGDWTVTFKPWAGDAFDDERMGEYTVTISSGKTSVTWTHDTVDLSFWQDDDLEASAWGQGQLLAALQRKQDMDDEREASFVDASDDDDAPTLPINAEMKDAANQILMEQYGLTDATLALFSTKAIVSETSDDGNIDVIYLPTYAENMSMIAEKMGGYYVTLNPASGEVLKAWWSKDDVWEDKTYTQSNWGSASAYHAKLLPWLLELFDATDKIAESYGLDGRDAMTIDELSIDDKGAYDQLHRDAGFTAEDGYYHTMPSENDISSVDALKIARQVLMQDLGFTEAQLDAGQFSGTHQMEQGNQPIYFFFFYPAEGPEHYGVELDARTGEVLYVDVVAGGNG